MISTYKNHLRQPSDLETSYVETRAGFVAIAMEKGKKASPYVEEARALANILSSIKDPNQLIQLKEIRTGMIAASGLSNKAAKHLGEAGCSEVILEFVERFLLPAGEKFAEEVIFRFLLTKGDTLGGAMRNLVGMLAQQKLNSAITAALRLAGIPFHWLHKSTKKWISSQLADASSDGIDLADGLSWELENKSRTIIYNIKVPIVKNNVDILLLNAGYNSLNRNQMDVLLNPSSYVALGELKGGIDPAGADEHWKTAKSALNRIAKAFSERQLIPLLFFVGAAIETAMSKEIWEELNEGKLANAANLTKPQQITSICHWLIGL